MTTIIETTDAPSSTATPYRMLVGDVFYGSASQNATDWIAVTLVAGQRYSFGAVGLGAAGSGVTDPLLKLHRPNGLVVTQDDDSGPGFGADMSYVPLTSGTYYVEVQSLSGVVGGDYGLVVSAGALPSYAADLGAAVLYRSGLSWAPAPETAVNLTWGVRRSGPAQDANGAGAPFSVLTAAQIAATESALDSFAEVGNINFTRIAPAGTTNAATILVGAYTSTSDGAGAYAQFPGSTATTSVDGDVWINRDSVSLTSIPIGSYDYWVFLHELGHALGLDHPGDYNAAPGVAITYQNAAQFVEDSLQYTVMSYFMATDTEADCPATYSDTLMLYDIYAIQSLYGVNTATRAGNDIYGFNATLGGAYNFAVNKDPLMCIWDGAGLDTLNLSGFGGAQKIDLNDGAFSNVGGFTGNLSIAWGAMIESAVGGRGSDQIVGNELNNVLRGGPGADVLTGGGGNDRLVGGTGVDGFVFENGFGLDRIVDFNPVNELIRLSNDLWGGAAMTGAQVLASYGVLRGGVVVLDFGPEELMLLAVTTTAGLADNILVF